jgi:hypothetical protein
MNFKRCDNNISETEHILTGNSEIKKYDSFSPISSSVSIKDASKKNTKTCKERISKLMDWIFDSK